MASDAAMVVSAEQYALFSFVPAPTVTPLPPGGDQA
jgi:hypothetical protein